MNAVRRRLWWRAARWLALLGPLFYLSYGLANEWARTRAHLPSVVFEWERGIPFLSWTVFPYWSINAFYALALFLAPSAHQMDRHAARLLTAQALAVSCFLLWPLHFSFGTPPASGAAGALFDALRSFDQPYNQAPSLHIALAVILWDWYRRRLPKGAAQAVLHLWTLAICACVLTTWQHHFIDIPTGALLGLVCVWLWPLERVASLPHAWRLTHNPRRLRLAACYATGAAACFVLALKGGGGLLWVAWAAVALALVALNYLGFGERGFAMDRHGRMHWAARWLLAPYRMGAWINAYAWTWRTPAPTELQAGLWIGRLPSASEWRRTGRPRLLSLCAELQGPVAPGIRCLPMLDLVPPSPARLRRAAAALERQRRQGGPMMVCCALGVSRSAAVAVAWLVLYGGASAASEAEALVRLRRPQVVLNGACRRGMDRLDDGLAGASHE